MRKHPSETPLVEVLWLALYKTRAFAGWESKVLLRDGLLCQDCKKYVRPGELEAHHKKHSKLIIEEQKLQSVDDLLACTELFDIANGTTLCKNCHKKIWQKR